MMYLGKDAVGIAVSKNITTIHQTEFTVDNITSALSIKVDEKPNGIMITTDTRTPYLKSNNTYAATLLDFTTTWCDYQGGKYYKGINCLARDPNNANPFDFYNIDSANINYNSENNTFNVTLNVAQAVPDRTYYVWYYTIPFNEQEVTPDV